MGNKQWVQAVAQGRSPRMLWLAEEWGSAPAAPLAESDGRQADGVVAPANPWVLAECFGAAGPQAPAGTAIHFLAGSDEIPCRCLIPTEQNRAIAAALAAAGRLRGRVPEELALFAPLQGPFSLACQLRGSGLLEDLTQKPGYVGDLMDFCAEAVIRLAGMYLQAGMDGLLVLDPCLALLSPGRDQGVLADGYHALFDYIRASGALSILSVPGGQAELLAMLSGLGADLLRGDDLGAHAAGTGRAGTGSEVGVRD